MAPAPASGFQSRARWDALTSAAWAALRLRGSRWTHHSRIPCSSATTAHPAALQPARAPMPARSPAAPAHRIATRARRTAAAAQVTVVRRVTHRGEPLLARSGLAVERGGRHHVGGRALGDQPGATAEIGLAQGGEVPAAPEPARAGGDALRRSCACQNASLIRMCPLYVVSAVHVRPLSRSGE